MGDLKFEKEIKERLANYTEEPDKKNWVGIVNMLSQSSGGLLLNRKKITAYSLISVSLIVIFLTLYLYKFDEQGAMRDKESQIEEIESKNDEYVEDDQLGLDHESKVLDSNTSKRYGNEEIVVANVPDRDEYAEKSTVEPKNEIDYLSGYSYLESQLKGINKEIKLVNTKAPINDILSIKKKTKTKDSRLKFYFYGMPTFSYNRIDANDSDDILVSRIKETSAFSTDRLGFRLESGVSYQINKNLSAFSGLLYFQQDQIVRYFVSNVREVEVVVLADREAVLVPVNEEVEMSYENKIRNVGMQIGLMYRVSSKRFLQTIGTGVEFHKSLKKAKNRLNQFESPDYYTFYNLFYRLEYPNDRAFRVLFQPTFNYAFKLDEKFNTPFYIKPYGFGLNVGITFKF